MKPRGLTSSIVFFTLFFLHGHASPLQEPNLCGLPVCDLGKKFNYATGIKYTHKYSVDVAALFRGTSNNKSTLYTESLVHITFLTPCQGLLEVSDVTLTSEKPHYNHEEDEDVASPQLPRADDFRNAITSKSLRFSWHDGAITELCPDPSDPVWVLNYKRGILSAFHNTMQRFDIDSSDMESDVNGECVTNYQLKEARSTALVISREKVVSTCRNRYKYHAILQTDPYNFGSSFQTVPLVKSRHMCEFSIDRKMYNTIECEEVHTFQPMSQAENGSQAITRQRITFLREVVTNASLSEDPLTKRVSLLFDHNATPKPISGELKGSRDLLKELCQLDKDGVDIGYPNAFTKLVRVGRRLSAGALSQIYSRSKNLCSSGPKQISDLLPYLGTNAAVSVMVENMESVSKETAQEWLVAIGFIPRPNEETLRTVIKLLNYSDHQVLLSVSALAHSFCRYEANCLSTEPIQDIVTFLTKKLDTCKERLLTIEQRDETLMCLKAVGNLGVSSPGVSSALRQCILSDARDMEIRTAAVAAHRRLSCQSSREFFLDIYRNATFEPEIRIASYLQVMRCPNYHTISFIRQQLDHEEVNQVGSFVWSHLQNQLTSSMPTKVEVQTLLTDRLLNDKFNKDHRKFSRSYESSMFFDEFNAGGNLESHVIFSPKSYVPRTLMANLTLDLFGETVNVLEVEARFEGLEHLVEAIFGPGGPVSASKVSAQVDRVLRLIRNTGSLAEHLNEIPNVIDNNFKVPKLALGYKIFGNEIFYSSVTGHQEFWKLVDKFNPVSRLHKLLSGDVIVIDKASMFLEGDYIVPTGVGLPVTLSIQGASAMNFNMSGNVKNLDPLALDIEGKFKPSLAVEVTGEMGIDAYYASAGVKLKASVYTSTAVEGHVKVEGKTKATLSFNLPKEKGEIITARTKLIVLKGDQEEEQQGITDLRVATSMCSWPSLDHTLGLKACMDAGFPNASYYIADDKPLLSILGPPAGNLSDLSPSFFLSGPSHLAIGVYKADPSAEKYVLQYNWLQKVNTTEISVVFDTPGSKQRRELSARLLLDTQSKNLTLLLQTVDNKFEAHGKYKYTPKDKYLGFSLNINGKKHLVAQIGLRTNQIKKVWNYQPKLYLEISGERVVELSGSINATEKRDVTLYEVKLDFHTKKLSLKLAGYISQGQASWSTKMSCNYRFLDSGPQRLTVELRVGNTSSKSLTQYNGHLTVESTAYSYLNFESSLKYQRAQGHAEAKLIVNTRPDLKDDRYKFTAHVGFSIHKSYERVSLNAFIEATKPVSNIDLRLAVSFNGQNEKSVTYLTIRYAAGKEVTASLALSTPRSDLLKFDGKLNVTLPGFVPMIIVLKLDEKKMAEYDIDLEAVWFSGHNLTASGVYVDKSEGMLKNYGLKMFIQSPSFEDITFNAKFVSDENQFKIDLQAEHIAEKYAFVLKHASYAPGEMESYGEVRYKSSLYTANAIINLQKTRRVVIELHLDKYRDVHIILTGENQARLKEMAIEVKWDANRDPGQKFAGRIRFNHPKTLVYSVDASATYPGRKIFSSADLSVAGTKFDSGLHLEWSPSDVMDVRIGAVYSTGNITDLRLSSQLLTPFVGWKKTSLAAGIHSRENLFQANGSVWWQEDQMVGVNLYWDYALPELNETKALTQDLDDDLSLEQLLHVYFPDFWCAFNASLFSTVVEVRPVHAAFNHRQKRNSMDTLIHWQGKAPLPILVRSRWELEGSEEATLMFGNITLTSPYKGYHKGLLIGRLSFTTKWNVDGFAELNLDRKEYFGTIKGFVKSMRDSMLVFNVTTPISQLSSITGRMGYSEADRHLVCMWTMPNSTLGVEVRVQHENVNNFDILLHLATPLEFFSKFLILGKRKEQLVDLRLGFNQLLLGVVGSWRYVGLSDFDYEYTLYTPLEGFKETTLVAKILIREGIDLDMRLRVVGVKVGITMLWVRKTTGLRRPLLKLVSGSEEEDKEGELRWRGSCKIDTYVYPTVTCDFNLDRIGRNTVIEANMVLPKGNIYLYDEFYFKDAFNIKNDLQLTTPFVSCPEISSVANFHLVLLTDLHLELELHVRAANVTKKGGLVLRYKRDGPNEEDYAYDEPEVDEGNETVPIVHAATLQFFTPWEALPLLQMSTLVELMDTASTSNLTVLTNQTWFTIQGATVSDKDYKKVKVSTKMVSPTFTLPEIIIEGKSDVSNDETNFELAAKCPYWTKSYMVSGKYSYVPLELLNIECLIETSSEKLQHLLVEVKLHNKSDFMSLHGKLHNRPGLMLEINGKKNNTALFISAERKGIASLFFDGTLAENNLEQTALKGALILKNNNGKWEESVYDIDTVLVMLPEKPLELKVALEPRREGDRSVFIEVVSFKSEYELEMNMSVAVARDSLKLTTSVSNDMGNFVGFSADLQSSLPSLKDIHSALSVEKSMDGRWDLSFKANLPNEQIRNVTSKASYISEKHSRRLTAELNSDVIKGQLRCEYSWLYLENMCGLFSGSYQLLDDKEYRVHTELFYRHPGQNLKLISSGLDVNLDEFYRFGTNATLALPSAGDVAISMNLKLPRPGDIHSVAGKMRYTPGYSYVAHSLQYSSLEGHDVTSSSGEISINKTEVVGNVKFEWGTSPNPQALTNVFLYKKPNASHVDLQYTLHSPYYIDDTLVARITGDCPVNVWDVKAHLNAPRSRQVISANISYLAFNNVNGSIQSKTPFPKLPDAGVHFEVLSTSLGHFRRHLVLTWPNNSALVKSDYWDVYTMQPEGGRIRDLNGQVYVEVPLATRLVTNATYKYQDAYPKSSGECTVNYKGGQLLRGKFGCLSESRAGYTKDDMDIEVDNKLFPLGVHYIHEVEYEGLVEDTDTMLSTDRKWADVFKLNNRTAFNMAGELTVKTVETGKEIKVQATQANTTVDLDTDYHFLDHQFTHRSKLTLSPTVWVSYYLDIINKTNEVQEEGNVRFDVAYPNKNFTLNCRIRQDSRAHNSAFRLDWNRPHNPRTIGAGFDWWRASHKPDQQVATLRLKHPSFVKDVTFNSTYIRHGRKSLFTRFEVEYSNETDKKLLVEGKAQDLSAVGSSLYQVDLTATHPATRLDLGARGILSIVPAEYEVRGDARYKRSFLGLQNGHLLGRIDGNLKAINLEKRLQHEESYFKVRLYTDEPCCTRLNGTFAKTQTVNYTADFLVDVDEKLLLAVVNMTEDGSENLRAHGFIPDARFAEMNVWRTYDDLTVTDIACYLRLNHSRLITSRVHWRPTLRKELLAWIEDAYLAVLKHLDDTVDYWKDYIRSEVKEAVIDIYHNAESDVERFVDDLEDLKTLESDFENLRTFLNDSYNRNDFYVKDITGAVLLLVDELELKKHVGAVPAVLAELWQALGESGEAIRKSLAWIIETVKNSYRKAMDLIHQLLHGDSSAQISSLLEEWITRYDRTVKELQMTVLRHIEQLYNSITDSISEAWTNLLRSIEPTYIQILHYLEEVAVSIGDEIMDFLYEREAELKQSPFFIRIANFTRDLDQFHHDLVNRDIFTNIHDYSTRFYTILRDRYLPKIPFGIEIHKVVAEIVESFKELEKLPSVNYLMKKKDEAMERFVWFWQSLDLGSKLQRVATIVHKRLMDISANALQSENKYREAKTKFIFEPVRGLVLLEQKLPMSWHAFNETPRFEEIPEYRALAVLQSQLTFSNKTFWAFYYEYMPITDISNWFPPFKAQAMIAGSQHLVTFDGRFISFRGDCDYLLARDFVDSNFSLIMSHAGNKSEQFLLSWVTSLHTIIIDIFNDEVQLPKGWSLPAQLGDTYVYKEHGIVTVEKRDGYTLKCNTLFQVCTLSLSGWFYGKTAGLLGTMDHEITSDLMTSHGFTVKDVGVFARSWAINREKCAGFMNKAHIPASPEEELQKDCTSLFHAKSSHFSTCFGLVNPGPYLRMCMASEKEKCSAAAAYVLACAAQYTPLTIPDICVTCKTTDGKKYNEGSFLKLSAESVPRSADVVFIVEAKSCNENMTRQRNMGLFFNVLAKKLDDVGLKNNRYATVVFGGSGVFDSPRAIIPNQVTAGSTETFTSGAHAAKAFQRFVVGNGTEDIFEAIAYASTLQFRPGVSKVFIVLPCSSCDPSRIQIEYSVLRQVMLENNIRLHLLMNDDFEFKKKRLANSFYGIDNQFAYTKKDKDNQYDRDLRLQVKIPKSMVAYCAPLALETNGSVFSAKWLISEKSHPVNKFAGVVAKRVAAAAEPAQCQLCECASYDTGMGYMHCQPCEFPAAQNPQLGPEDYVEGEDMGESFDYEDTDDVTMEE